MSGIYLPVSLYSCSIPIVFLVFLVRVCVRMYIAIMEFYIEYGSGRGLQTKENTVVLNVRWPYFAVENPGILE